MAPRTPGVVQKENISIDSEKDGLKADLLKLAKTGLINQNDVQEMQKELVKKRVKKKVDKETPEDIDGVKEMELEPEVAHPHVDRRLSRSSDKLFGEAELSEPLSVGRPVDIKLKDFS